MGNSEVPQAPGSTRNDKAAFTRIELLAILVALALLAALALPVLATSTANSQAAQCLNNLRQIGRAVRLWSGDHFEEPPWLTPTTDGGTRPTSGIKIGAAWFEYTSLSNELVTPRILACPNDVAVKVASQWTGPNALVDSAFRQQAISYMLGLHANFQRPMALLAADHNIQLNGRGSCGPAAVNDVPGIITTIGAPPPETIRWTNGPHLYAGHLLVVDGSVMFLNSSGLTRTLSRVNSSAAGVQQHVLPAH